MKKLSSLILCLIMIVMLCSCAGSGSADSNAIGESVTEYFMALSQIPRGTYNEQAVSDYLLTWAQDRGYEVTQDDYNNIIFDVPATKGYEDAPRVGLQGHMDMVIAVDEGYDFDPAADPITVIRDGDTITAEHTTLGADDGIGISIIQYIVENSEAHGPLRIIITTDEENTSTGVKNLDPKYVSDVDCMINIDNEEDDQIVVSSAGFISSKLEKDVTAVPSIGDTAYELAITGSAGGHSGHEIANGRVNSMVALCDFLYYIQENGINYQLVSAQSGTAANAIPTSAKATIVMDSSQEDKLQELATANAKFLQDTYCIKNPDINCTATRMDKVPEEAMSDEDANALICLVQNAVSGIYTLSQKEDGLVESSSNPGILNADTEKIHIEVSTRSSETAPELHITNALNNLADTLGFTRSSDIAASPWPMSENNELCNKAVEIYKKHNGSDPRVEAIHAGLECGAFAQMNPGMDIISIGPTITGPHTTSETTYISSVAKITKLVDELVAELAK